MASRYQIIAVLVILVLLIPFLSLSSQEKNEGQEPFKIINEIPSLSHAPKIDGVLDNDLWEREALKIEEFLQFLPKEKEKPTQKTVVYLGRDKKNLYIAFRCFDTEPQKIRASVTNRDNIMDDDWVLISLDTFNEKRRAFWFILNPLGIQLDAIRVEEGGDDNLNASWDTVFYSDGQIDDQGYIIEVAIPFKSLRFPNTPEKKWGLVLGRTIARSGEIIIWPTMTKSIPGLLTQEGEFVIRGEVEKGRNFEFMPILTTLKTSEKKIDLQPGLNFKWGISSDITLDLTLNPDFSQIEADAPQIDVNRRFALYYPEKRPFFLEGMEIFRFPQIEMVYTRRIIDPIAGAKLTGKVGRFAYGLLTALDTSPTESLWEVHNGRSHTSDNALFNIFRIKTDVFSESYLGFCLADKEIDGSYNRVFGFDGQFRFKNHYFFSFQAVASQSKFDDETTSLAPAVFVDAYYYSKYWGGGFYWMSIHPEFEAASGFVNRVDYRTINAYTFFNLYPEKKNLSSINFHFSLGRRYDYFSSNVQDEWFRGRINVRFTEFNQLTMVYTRSMEQYSGRNFYKNTLYLTGQFIMFKWLTPLGFELATGDNIFYDPEDPFLGYSNTYGVFMNFRPSKRWQMGVTFSKQTFWERWGGRQLFDYNVIRQRTTYQISKELSLRVIMDYNHFYKKIYGSFLLSYILKPGTVFFLGLENNLLRGESGKYAQRDYSIFIKFSYWWRI
ncbi:MAG: carbohydrate binding family 9 domain-containing protein [Candidatus Aminicenantes bacterium]|nr:carbohydrate binding family 9 domain-containing protein [Candidatus Aminicenantes bacterium]